MSAPIRPESSGDTIRFDHADGGIMDISSETSLGKILMLGAVVHTAKRELSDTVFGDATTATDAAGLQKITAYLCEANYTLLDGIGLVAKLMAFSSTNLSDSDINRLGWLIAGLTELSQELQFSEADIVSEIARRGEDG